MATRTAGEAVAAIDAENAEAERLQERRTAGLTHALNWYANRGELKESNTSQILNLARRYSDFLEQGVGNPFDSDEAYERLAIARELISGWLAYMRAGVVNSELYADLVGDSVIFLSEASE
jgi:hypothetical protein